MKNAEEFISEFMTTFDNMKKYQRIDITKLETYFDNLDIIHDSFNLEKNVVATVKAEEISSDVRETVK